MVLEECPELSNEGVVVWVHGWRGSLAVLVGHELATGVECKDVAVDVVEVQFTDVGWASPDSMDMGIVQSLPEHDLAFANLQVSMDQMDSKFLLHAIGKDELQDLLKMGLGDLTLIPVVGQRVVPFPARLSVW